MKKIILAILVALTVALFVACAPELKGEEDMDAEMDLDSVLYDYYPFQENKVYEYIGIGSEFAEETIYYEFIDNNKAQLKIQNPGTTVVKIIEISQGMVREIYSEGEFYHIEDILDLEGDREEVLLKEPIRLRNSWPDSEGNTREITGVDVDIETPYGSFKALEVSTDINEATVKEYYAKGIGLVAHIYKDGDFEIKSLLKSIKEGPISSPIRLYYPSEEGELVFIDDKINFSTNQEVERLLEEAMKRPPKRKLRPLINEDTKINSIYLDRNLWLLKVDFSQELLAEDEEKSALDDKLLLGIVNTLGYYYDVDKLAITVEGIPIKEQSHLPREDGAFKVDLENIKEYKQ